MRGLADALRTRRKRKGLSQRHLAELMGVHENTVLKMEHNPERALLGTIEKAADALGITVSVLFAESQRSVGNRSRSM